MVWVFGQVFSEDFWGLLGLSEGLRSLHFVCGLGFGQGFSESKDSIFWVYSLGG